MIFTRSLAALVVSGSTNSSIIRLRSSIFLSISAHFLHMPFPHLRELVPLQIKPVPLPLFRNRPIPKIANLKERLHPVLRSMTVARPTWRHSWRRASAPLVPLRES
jgi:hypothetical protein